MGSDVTLEQSEVGSTPTFDEPHYSVAELAKLWRLDHSTIRRMFQDEPGVFRHGKAARRDGKPDYVTLRIPRSVARRFHTKHCS